MNSVPRHQGRGRRLGLTGIALLHALISYGLVFSRLIHGVPDVVVVGILIGQCSLAMGLIVLQVGNRWLQIAGALLLGLSIWHMIVRRVLLLSHGELWATWAVIVSAHTCLTMMVMRLSLYHADIRTELGVPMTNGETKPSNFELISLIQWTTVAAILFAITQLGIQFQIWDKTTHSLQQMMVLIGFGLMCSIIGYLAFFVAASRKLSRFALRLIVSMVLPVILIALINDLSVATELSGTSEIKLFFKMAAAQWVTVAVSIGLFRLVINQRDL